MPRRRFLRLGGKEYEKRLKTPLTRREEKFVKALVSQDGMITQGEAAIEAGYPVSSAHVRASEMMNPYICPHVVKAVQDYRNQLDKKYAVTYQRHIKRLDDIGRKAEESGAWSAVVQAEYRRGLASGLYINRSEVRHGAIDQMDKADVLKALKEIKKNYGGDNAKIIDADAQEIKEFNEENGEEVLPEDTVKLLETSR